MIEGLMRTWTTDWGSGRILNALLFQGEHVCSETQAEFAGQSSKKPLQPDGDASALFAVMFF